MIKAEIKSRFHGVINGVSIDSEEIYTSAEYILDVLQRELDIDIDKETIETYSYCLERSQMKDEYYSLSDIENEILRLIGERDFRGPMENKYMNPFYKLIANKLTEYEMSIWVKKSEI